MREGERRKGERDTRAEDTDCDSTCTKLRYVCFLAHLMCSELVFHSDQVISHWRGLGLCHGSLCPSHPLPQPVQHVLKVVEFQQDTGQSLTVRPCMGRRERRGRRRGRGRGRGRGRWKGGGGMEYKVTSICL